MIQKIDIILTRIENIRQGLLYSTVVGIVFDGIEVKDITGR